MKHEWKKSEKELYAPKGIQQIVVNKQKYITIKGKGDPNGEDFAKRVEALYAMAYGVRMSHKSEKIPAGYFEYTVYPLEGVWSTEDVGDVLNKSKYIYTIMIRQPEFVNEEVFQAIFERVQKKKPQITLLKEIKLQEIEDGEVVQMIHIGSYDEEPISFKKMNDYIEANNLTKRCFEHREIYLSDPRKIDASKQKTILRYFVSK